MIGRGHVLGITLLLCGLLGGVTAEAQQAAKVDRIGYLGSKMSVPQNHEALLQGLRDLGYVEGRNVVIEYRDPQGRVERVPALIGELVALKVDVIFAPSTPYALAAKQAPTTVPIVFVSLDAVASGIVPSLARPGGNLTGLSGPLPELVGKWLELLTQTVPGVSQIAVLWQPGAYPERVEREMLKGADVAGRAMKLRLQIVEARRPADLDKAV